jgi:hypothetical protein
VDILSSKRFELSNGTENTDGWLSVDLNLSGLVKDETSGLIGALSWMVALTSGFEVISISSGDIVTSRVEFSAEVDDTDGFGGSEHLPLTEWLKGFSVSRADLKSESFVSSQYLGYSSMLSGTILLVRSCLSDINTRFGMLNETWLFSSVALIPSDGFGKTALDDSCSLPSSDVGHSARIVFSDEILDTKPSRFSSYHLRDRTLSLPASERLPASRLFAVSNRDVLLSVVSARSAAFSGSPALARSILPSGRMSALPVSHPLDRTDLFVSTNVFSPTQPAPTPTPTITASPIPTESEYVPRQGLTETWIASLSFSLIEVSEESIMVSFSELEHERLVVLTFLVDDVVTMSNSIVVEQTHIAISWMVIVITQLPSYVTVNRRVVFLLNVTPEAQMKIRLSNAVLIGTTCGAAAAITLLVMAVIAVFRSKVRSVSVAPDKVEFTVNRSSNEDFEELGRLDDPVVDMDLGIHVDVSDLDLESEDDAIYI